MRVKTGTARRNKNKNKDNNEFGGLLMPSSCKHEAMGHTERNQLNRSCFLGFSYQRGGVFFFFFISATKTQRQLSSLMSPDPPSLCPSLSHGRSDKWEGVAVGRRFLNTVGAEGRHDDCLATIWSVCSTPHY